MVTVPLKNRRFYRMKVWRKARVVIGVLLSATIVGLGVSTYLLKTSEGENQVISLSRVQSATTSDKSRGQIQYENAWSEQIMLESKVKPYENYLINWLSTYVGRKGFQGQNTGSLKYGDLENNGAYTNMTDLIALYPNLSGVIERVDIQYSYDSVSKQLVQKISLYKRGVEGYRQATVIYDSVGSVVDYTLGSFVKVGGSDEKD